MSLGGLSSCEQTLQWYGVSRESPCAAWMNLGSHPQHHINSIQEVEMEFSITVALGYVVLSKLEIPVSEEGKKEGKDHHG